jgi:hypothetical protein
MRWCAVKYIFLCCLMCFGWLNASWSSPADLSLPYENAYSPQIGIDSSGNATAVWEGSNGVNSIIQASTKPFGGTWQMTPDNLSLPGLDAYRPQIGIDSSGNATVVWQRSDGDNSIIQASTKSSEGWQTTPDNLSLPGLDADYPQIGIDSSGNATAVWQTWNGSNSIIQASTKLFEGAWQETPDNLSLAGQNAYSPQIGIDSSGNATVVWFRNDGMNYIIQASTKSSEGWQTTPDNLSLAGQNAYSPQIGIDSSGKATAVWQRSDGMKSIIQASTKSSEGWQTTPDNLSLDGQDAYSPQIGIDSSGNATVVWQRSDGMKFIIQASTHFFRPTVTNLNPNFGPKEGGNAVTITGTDFLDVTSVYFGSTPASSFTVESLTTITAIAPPGTGTVDITVTASSKTSPITTTDQYTYIDIVPAPSVTNLNPNFGPKEGGNAVTITGTDFLDVTSVYFGSTPASSFTVESLTTITAIAPPGTGTVDITVTASSKASPITTTDQYTYIDIVPAPSGFKGKAKHKKKKLIVKTKWNKDPVAHIVRYEIFARNKKITTVSARKKAKEIIRLHPHHIPHSLSKKYRMYLHHKYKIRAIDSTGTASHFTFLTIVH